MLQGFETYGIRKHTKHSYTLLIIDCWCGQTALKGKLTKQRQLYTQPTIMSTLNGPAQHNNSLQGQYLNSYCTFLVPAFTWLNKYIKAHDLIWTGMFRFSYKGAAYNTK